MCQNSEIRFDCTTEEKNKIKSKAEKLGLTIKQYILRVSLNSETRIIIKSYSEFIPVFFINILFVSILR